MVVEGGMVQLLKNDTKSLVCISKKLCKKKTFPETQGAILELVSFLYGERKHE